ncbi:hypothetical protein QUF75_00315 [Desulfococcaceae bacterium HSG7]|nr:hypothetical protein [Desulfococcaceae bacterium HSG7]
MKTLSIKLAVLFAGILAVLLISVLSLGTTKTSALLTQPNQWRVYGQFILNGEYKGAIVESDRTDLQRVMKHIKGIMPWASWAGNDHHIGRLVSSTFIAPAKIDLFVVGYPHKKGNQLYLEQSDTGEKMEFPGFNPGEEWKKITLEMPPEWRQTRVRIVAIDDTSDGQGWLGVTSPFTIIPWHYHLERHKYHFFFLLRFLPLYLLSFAFFLIPGLFVASQLAKHRIYNYYDSLLMACVFSAVCGYLLFWTYFFNHSLGKGLTAVLMLTSCYVCIQRTLRQKIYALLLEADVWLPLMIMAAVGLFYLSVLYIEDSGTSFHTVVATRFLEHQLPRDSIIPYLLSEKLFAGLDPRILFGDWQSSDRPPLQTGIVLSQRLLGSLFCAPKLHYQIIATIAQCAWIPALWCLCRHLKLTFFKIAAVFMFLIFSGFFLFNSAFVWPKLLAGAFVVGTFILLIGHSHKYSSYKHLHIILAASLSALSVLSHGGGVFTLMAIVMLLLWPSYFPGVRSIILGVLTFLLFLAPWLAYQKFYDPPGNRLVKWHIAGVIPIDDRSITQTLKDSYSRLDQSQYFRGKIENFKVLLGEHIFSPPGLDRQHKSQRRRDQFYHFLHTFGILNIGWLLLLISLFQSMLGKRVSYLISTDLKNIFWVGLSALLIWVFLMFIPGSTVVHQGSYATMILLFCGLAVIVTELPRWLLYGMLFWHVTDFCILWIYPHTTQWNYSMVVTTGIALILILTLLYRLSSPRVLWRTLALHIFDSSRTS